MKLKNGWFRSILFGTLLASSPLLHGATPLSIGIRPPDTHGWAEITLPEVFERVITVDASTNLVNWSPIATLHDPVSRYFDPAAGTFPSRFYRLSLKGRTAQDDWKNQAAFPYDPFLSTMGSGETEARWMKFAILRDEPHRVYFQDSVRHLFHYDFAVARLAPFSGMNRAEFDRVSLHREGQRVVLGAILFPPDGGGAEFGVQLVGLDPYPPGEIARWFHTIRSAVAPEGQPLRALYMPTFEQAPSSEANREALGALGVELSSAERWTSGDSCYSSGWALGRVRFIPATEIAAAYADGRLGPGDILLTDGVPAELPFVSGIISLSPATPNSHVAILARSYGIPFVHLSEAGERERARLLHGREAALRAFDRFGRCEVRLIDLDGTLSPEYREEILALKKVPPIKIQPKERLGSISAPVDALTPSDIRYFGGKASNFGLLRRMIPAHSPHAIAFSFDLWDGFMDQVLPGGKTLREEIHGRIGPFSYPPDMRFVRAELEEIRGLIRRTAQFSPVQKEAIISSLAVFDPLQKIRFRSSTNVEDAENFTGAGLYDSYSGCLADDTDSDASGPSRCDPLEPNERGVFRAIQRVYASFYNENAFLERLRHGLDESQAGMAVLVHHSFPDEIEAANGVATITFAEGSIQGEMVTQAGAVSVTNPDTRAVPEVVHVSQYTFGTYLTLRQSSSLVQLGAHVLEWEKDYRAFLGLFAAVSEGYRGLFPGKTEFLLDFEYKKLTEGSLTVKQVREVPRPNETERMAPFLINEPTEFVVFQGEYGDVFGNHRLKSRLALSTRNVRLTSPNRVISLYGEAGFEYLDGARTRTLAGNFTQWPGVTHRVVEDEHHDGWEVSADLGTRRYLLKTADVPAEVSPSENPLLTLRDFRLALEAGYSAPQISFAAFEGGWTNVTRDSVLLIPKPVLRESDLLQERHASVEEVGIETRFYWPKAPTGIGAGYTAPLVDWVETEIRGLTAEPLRLRGQYSQTYRPEHHNFSEHFLFEPQLEPDLARSILDALEAADIQMIYVYYDRFDPERTTITLIGFGGAIRELAPGPKK